MGGWGRSRADQIGRAMRVLLGTAQPVLWGSLLSAATDLSFASVLSLATDRTRSGTAFGNIWKRDSAIAARGDDVGVLHLSLTSPLDLDSWLEILPPSKSLSQGVFRHRTFYA